VSGISFLFGDSGDWESEKMDKVKKKEKFIEEKKDGRGIRITELSE
jgi:hypothetical protein